MTDRKPETAELNSYKNGATGACIYLSPTDLRELGVDPTVASLTYWVDSETQQLRITNQYAESD
jgi:hypothetical protein